MPAMPAGTRQKLNPAWPLWIGPVRGAADLVYTDTASGTLTLSGTSTESAVRTDTAAGTITLSGSSVELYETPRPLPRRRQHPNPNWPFALKLPVDLSGIVPVVYSDAASGTLTLSGTRTESSVRTDTASGTVTLSGSRVESSVRTDTGSGTLTLSGSRVESSVRTDTATGTVTFSGSRVEGLAHSSTAAGTVTLSGTSVESHFEPYKDSASGVIHIYGPVMLERFDDGITHSTVPT